MPDVINTVTATLSQANPAKFTIGGHEVDVYGTWTYQWDQTTNLLVNSAMTGSVTVKDVVTGVKTVFTNPVVNYDGSKGGIAEILFASGTTTPAGSTTSFNQLYLDWTGENPTTLYTGTNPVSGGALYTSVKQVTPNNGGGTSTNTYHVNNNAGGVISDADTCFAAGTHILTPHGEILVENLQIGDLVEDANGAGQAVKWLGYRNVNLRNLQNPAAKYLVRVLASAFAPNVPHRDLLITQEHCLFIDGSLIPARMLVNGSSIILDSAIQTYTYYHVELERHGILLAEGLAAESYLDTGNRGNFSNSDTVSMVPDFTLHAEHKNWAQDAAAPLATEHAIVQPIWQRLKDRAAALGLQSAVPAAVTDNSDLHLVTQAGQIIRATRVTDGRHMFIVPAGAGAISLHSRTFSPAVATGPFVDDRRQLGALVGEIMLTQGRQSQKLDAHLTQDELTGWHTLESSQARWTNGNAMLPAMVLAQPAVLEVQILQTGLYAVAEISKPVCLAA